MRMERRKAATSSVSMSCPLGKGGDGDCAGNLNIELELEDVEEQLCPVKPARPLFSFCCVATWL